ncbi:MAG: hypothetical protein OXL96_13930 [Candidatus Poribacteria bacterium]|nr:hypothetical protein [Candidatus Poribacteria bacterium]
MINAQTLKDILKVLKDIADHGATAVMLLKQIHENTSQPPAVPIQDVREPIQVSEPELIEVSGMAAPWVASGLEWDGKSEVADEAKLTDFLGFNPNGKTGGMSWCAGFWLAIFQSLGFDVDGLDRSVLSFSNFGYDLLEKYDAQSLPNGAILVFQPDPDGEFPISHVGVKVDDDKLFGGNQGDKVKRSNLAWYLQHAKLVAARCPDGYKLV